ncbi:MAG TPA: DMT family transporter [Ktedonobacterales bacterium]|nr:DMT family transporter [Ktedonobacterales bacterium]
MSQTDAQKKPTSIWRLFALLLAVCLSTSASLLAKYALQSFSPFTVTALRIWIAALVMLPIAIWSVPGGLHWRSFRNALPMSLCYGLNSTCFALGIGFTTALSAQLIYMLGPVLALIGARIFFHEALTLPKIIGTGLGIIGVVIVLFGSSQGGLGNSLGTPLGNGFILLAATAWTAFTLLAQRQSKTYHPLELACYALTTCALIMPLLVLPDILRQQAIHASVTWLALLSAVGLALLVSVGRDAAFQWGIHGSSAFVANAMGFVAPFLTVAYAIPLLGERLSVNLLVSGVLILAGLIFAVILPARQHYQARAQAQASPLSGTLAEVSIPSESQATLPTEPDEKGYLP